MCIAAIWHERPHATTLRKPICRNPSRGDVRLRRSTPTGLHRVVPSAARSSRCQWSPVASVKGPPLFVQSPQEKQNVASVMLLSVLSTLS
ncbi:hypothetical protein VTO73DRAFT_10848 [Trametes versicolor]